MHEEHTHRWILAGKSCRECWSTSNSCTSFQKPKRRRQNSFSVAAETGFWRSCNRKERGHTLEGINQELSSCAFPCCLAQRIKINVTNNRRFPVSLSFSRLPLSVGVAPPSTFTSPYFGSRLRPRIQQKVPASGAAAARYLWKLLVDIRKIPGRQAASCTRKKQTDSHLFACKGGSCLLA